MALSFKKIKKTKSKLSSCSSLRNCQEEEIIVEGDQSEGSQSTGPALTRLKSNNTLTTEWFKIVQSNRATRSHRATQRLRAKPRLCLWLQSSFLNHFL